MAPAREASPGWWEQLEVRDLRGAAVTPGGSWIVLIFLSPECPVANAGIPVLNALAKEFAPRGFDLVGAYSDPALKLSVLREHAAESRLAFAVADDRAQHLARATGAAYTPEVFVFSRAGALLYRGRIDDRVRGFGPARPVAAHEDLREVLTALAAGRTERFRDRPGFGCTIPNAVRP
jgi:hypothetical protein